jgi:N-methylhydantoinase A
MRYVGQSFELSVPIALDLDSIESVESAFGGIYAARYGAATDRMVEIVSYRVAAWGLSDKPALPPVDRPGCTLDAAISGTRSAIFDGAELQLTVFDRDRLPPHQPLAGPALIEEGGSTTVVPPNWTAELDRAGCLVLRRS